MINFEERKTKRLKEEYPKGTRVLFISTTDKHHSLISKVTEGSVCVVDDMGTIHINWDNGSTLGMVLEEDVIRKI